MLLADWPWQIGFRWELSWWDWFLAGSYVLAFLSIPSVLLDRRGRPQAALTWVLVLFLVPYLGLFFWWLMGRRHLSRRKRRRRKAAARISEKLEQIAAQLPARPEVEWDLFSLPRLPTEEKEWTFPATTLNEAELYVDAKNAFPAIEAAIEAAKHHIHVLFYIWRADETGRHFRDLLARKAAAGVEVRLLLDAIGGSRAKGRFFDPLRQAGGEIGFFAPAVFLRRRLELNFRNHRKLVLCDARRAVIGGLNIGDEYTQNWHDVALGLRGPVVDQLQEVFAEDWNFATKKDFTSPDYFGRWIEDIEGRTAANSATCGVVASGPHTEINLTLDAFFYAITRAKERIWLTTPYFVPDLSILAALRSAAYRGLDVRLMIPARCDHLLVQLASRSYYPELIRSGVRVFAYQPRILHSKTGLIDDIAVAGSANLDMRSFRLNFELTCFVRGGALLSDLEKLFQDDIKRAKLLRLADVERTSYVSRVAEAAAHLMSPLL